MDQPVGSALKLGHGDEQKRERRVFGTVGLGAHRFDQGFLAAIANGNFERQALADHIDAEQEKQKPDGGGVKGGDAGMLGLTFQVESLVCCGLAGKQNRASDALAKRALRFENPAIRGGEKRAHPVHNPCTAQTAFGVL